MIKGIAAGLAAGALWGLVFVAPRMTPGLSAVDLAAGRFASYGALSLVLMLVWRPSLRQRLPTFQQALAAFGLSLLGFTGYYLLLVLSIADMGGEVPTLIIGTIPIAVMLIGKPAGLQWSQLWPGLVLTLMGLLLMASSSWPHGAASVEPAGAHFWRGLIFALLAMACWTVFALANAAWLRRHPDVSATVWANWLGVATGLGAVLIWFFAGSPLNVLLVTESIGFIAMICIATGVGSAWLATVLWNIASQRLSTSLCGQLIVSETVFALVYSFLWDGHWPAPLQLLAAALFVAGILASIRAHR